MDTMRMKSILVLVAALAFALSPVFSGSFGGFDPNRYPVPQIDPPVQPAGYAFSIWGLIYLWLVVSTVYGLFRRAEAPDWDASRWPLFISLAIGAGWIPVAQQSPVWATVLILVMLVTAILALIRTPVMEDRWLLRAPLALYAGWLTAASSVSVALIGAGYGIGFGEVGWAFAGLALALAVALAVLRTAGWSPLYAAGVAWALVGVVVQNGTGQLALAIAAALGAVVVLVAGLMWNRPAGNPASGVEVDPDRNVV
jgi:hypothetical protein